MSLDSGMSREEKEKLLNQKMENIRRKNEELRKRHQEIEADKKNADIFSSKVTMDEVKPYKMKAPRSRPERSDKPREMLDHPPPPRPADIMPSRQRLSENDGPPPDPSYRFLSDPDRDGLETGRDNKREHWGRGGRGRGKRGGRGGGGSLWEGSEDKGMEIVSDRGRGNMRGDRGGSNFSEGEIDGKLDIVQTEGEFGGRGDKGFNRGRGRGRSNGNSYGPDGERRYEHGRGGRGRFNEKSRQENENFGPGNGTENSECGGGGGEDGRRGKISFASRDIRYYPDDGKDQRLEKSRGRGRGKYAQRHSFDEYDNTDRQRERGRGRGNFEHRSRGRGRGYGQYHEYEKWKAEREVIDEERLTRGRTHEGAWRREWDNDKLDQGNVEETEAVYDPRYPRSKSEAIKLSDFVITPEAEAGDSGQVQVGHPQAGHPPSQGQQGDRRSNAGRGSRSSYRGRGNYATPEINAQRHEEEIVAELEHDGVFDERTIEGHGDSFTVSVATTNQSTAGKFVRVGSGRRGKPASYIDHNEREFEESNGHGGDKQHQKGWARGNRNPRGRGRGRGQGYGSYTGKDKFVSKSVVGDGQASATSDSTENLETPQKHLVLSHSTSSTHCSTLYQTQKALSDAEDGASVITSALPADECSWTRGNSGNDSLETSVLSEGAPMDDIKDEEIPVKEIFQNDQCINNGSDDRLETEQDQHAEQHVNAEAFAEAEEDFDGKNCEDFEVAEGRPINKDCCVDVTDNAVSYAINRNGSLSSGSEDIIEATNSCQQEVLAVDLKASTKENVLTEDSSNIDSTISVNQENIENIITLPNQQNREESAGNEENITGINDKENSANATSEELYIENSNEKECSDFQKKFSSDEKTEVIYDAEVPKEGDCNENKKAENCLTPASSPTATEQLVPNIEWK
ncbi:uncharacterized protein [Procambarus clarkii]|uniref:uncharacterized protein isoform X1 n=1 Tax=Procambarus clarkii TaxID=6728 RepID=UPI00374307DE